jgi:hypothetical protein
MERMIARKFYAEKNNTGNPAIFLHKTRGFPSPSLDGFGFFNITHSNIISSIICVKCFFNLITPFLVLTYSQTVVTGNTHSTTE